MSTHSLQQLGQSQRTFQSVLMTFWLVNKAFEFLTHLKTSLEVLFSQMFNFQPGHLITVFNGNCVMFWKSNWFSLFSKWSYHRFSNTHLPQGGTESSNIEGSSAIRLHFRSGNPGRSRITNMIYTQTHSEGYFVISSWGCLPVTSMFSFSIWSLKLFSRILQFNRKAEWERHHLLSVSKKCFYCDV